jgi:hypothetical protein
MLKLITYFRRDGKLPFTGESNDFNNKDFNIALFLLTWVVYTLLIVIMSICDFTKYYYSARIKPEI